MNFGNLLQIGIVVEDVDIAINEYVKFEIMPWELVDFDGSHGFSYLDTYEQLGFYSEIHKGRTE